MRIVKAITASAALGPPSAATAAAAPAPPRRQGAAAARQYEGTVVSVNRAQPHLPPARHGARHRAHQGHGHTRFERINGFRGPARPACANIESVVRRSGGVWLAARGRALRRRRRARRRRPRRDGDDDSRGRGRGSDD